MDNELSNEILEFLKSKGFEDATIETTSINEPFMSKILINITGSKMVKPRNKK
jgi:hypothetical protein